MAKTPQEVTVKIYVEKLSKLVHSSANPRLITAKGNEDLKQSLTDFPEMKLLREIVVDEDFLILAGDKRAYMLEELGYEDVTIKQVFGLTEKKKREFIAKDNVHNGDWDPNIIASEWDGEELAGWGVPQMKVPGAEKETKDVRNHSVTCPGCGLEFDPKEAKDED